MSRDWNDQELHPRCPPLGGEVPFRHCRQVNEGLPCHRIVICWSDRMDVLTFLQEEYTREEIERMSAPPRTRLETILDTLDRVRSGKGAGSSGRG